MPLIEVGQALVTGLLTMYWTTSDQKEVWETLGNMLTMEEGLCDRYVWQAMIIEAELVKNMQPGELWEKTHRESWPVGISMVR